MTKRTHVYVMRPREYEMSGCECGNEDPDWSEFNSHLWCPKCQIDFISKSAGIFDGPIPVNGMHLMGIDMRRYNIETGQVEKFEEMR